MKVALVHDFLHQLGGAERVLEALHEIFPEAPVYTLIYDKHKVSYHSWKIIASPITRFLPFASHYQFYLPIFAKAVESFNLDKFDLVFSISYGWSKAIKTKACHICYCLTPLRFAHEMFEEYTRHFPGLFVKIIRKYTDYIKNWDLKTGGRPNYYIATCQNVAQKIKKYYQRTSIIIYPPVDTDFFQPGGQLKDYFLVVSRLTPYKRIDLAAEVFNQLKLPLKIIGTGPEEKRLKKMAGPTVEFLGRVSDEEVLKYYQECQALIFPGEEDFGLVPLEAQACGRPVIAFKKGGALETVIEGVTGLFFESQTAESLKKAVENFGCYRFNSRDARTQSLKFSKTIFKEKIKNFVLEKYAEHQKNPKTNF